MLTKFYQHMLVLSLIVLIVFSNQPLEGAASGSRAESEVELVGDTVAFVKESFLEEYSEEEFGGVYVDNNQIQLLVVEELFSSHELDKFEEDLKGKNINRTVKVESVNYSEKELNKVISNIVEDLKENGKLSKAGIEISGAFTDVKTNQLEIRLVENTENNREFIKSQYNIDSNQVRFVQQPRPQLLQGTEDRNDEKSFLNAASEHLIKLFQGLISIFTLTS
ncbi:hypothetical protein [Desertibacillus haloalkaliphilus]|uniref:hypothetical protein n=1 Tax=Desertibacillus haloalkaliphilus TaxID=1328930 RepID=UPI001C273B2B|nr:hypothetical protein [Desertibacillus haloalkaliphilus]MBU8907529.1 hypothetical protein [Desertibacillus haloalkaliphilus]